MATAAIAIPVQGTIIDTFRQSFVDVPVDAERDNAVSTTEFLDAAESLTTIFGTAPILPFRFVGHMLTTRQPDVMGSAGLRPVKSDMTGNIKV
jgi:hypothetical protein